MLFKIDPRIFKDFPGLTVGVVVAHDVDTNKQNSDVTDLLKKEQDAILKSISKDAIKEHPHIAPWREAYKKFGGKPKDNLPSIENLATRIVKLHPAGSVNTLVDLYNIISMKYLLPVGGQDLKKISGNIELTYADAAEKPVILLGEKEARAPEAGEVIYKDSNGATCRRWNWKEADRTKITQSTKHALFVLEGLPPITHDYVAQATHELAALIQKQCGGLVTVVILDEEHPSVVLQKDGIFINFAKHDTTLSRNPLHFSHEEQLHAKAASDEHRVRKEKVATLKQQGIEAWPEFENVTAKAADVVKHFDAENGSKKYDVAGRVLAIREHGKIIFATIQDVSGQLQIYLKQENIGADQFKNFKTFIDIGDIIWVSGISFKTKTGEITLDVASYKLLSKCLHPLPERFHGLRDVEIKYRQRYLDLITNAESKQRFIKRAQIVRTIRSFLDSHEFIEVETPILHPIPGGANARPFITHHNALGSDFYLRIAPELYLKRLVVGGLERVYEIGRIFRNEGISTRHNPEFTMLELYVAHHNYEWMMGFSEELLKKLAREVCGTTKIMFGTHELDFGKKFERISMHDAVVKYANIPAHDLTPQSIDKTIAKHTIKLDANDRSYGDKLFDLFDQLVETKLIQPTFITNFPIEVSPLAKRDPHNPDFVLRFEMFVAGMELSNAFNELNDPFDQAERFRQQSADKEAGNEEAHHYDADYILALEHALPPTVGFGIGIDRLTMLLTNTTSIKDVILFPTLKKK